MQDDTIGGGGRYRTAVQDNSN